MTDEQANNYWDRIEKGLVLRLVSKGDKVTAAKILDSEIKPEWLEDNFGVHYWRFVLVAQMADYEHLVTKQEELRELLNEVMRGTNDVCSEVLVCLVLPEAEEGWRENLRAQLRGENVRNQGNLVSAAPHEYQGLYFRSKSEIRMAAALDRAGLLYFPLPVACYRGKHREPDFLVHSLTGKWGILEVQGEPFHPASTAAKDHARARAFKRFGIPVEFFDARDCYNDADSVVADFVKVISQA